MVDASMAALPQEDWVVSPQWLQQHLDSPGLRVLDCTTVMTPQAVGASRISSGRPQWLAAHIPGSVHACMVEDFSDPDGAYPYTLPKPSAMWRRLAELGIGPEHHVVLVVSAQPMVATRVWWVMRALGHGRVSILDGGMPRWSAEGRPIASGEPTEPTRHSSAMPKMPPPSGWLVQAQAVADACQGPACQLVNALSREQFLGTGGAHYGRPGRIPGSLHVPASSLFEPQSMNWRPRAQLQEIFAQAGVSRDAQQVITYCGGGIAASVVAFALRWCEWHDAALYDNSLLEWAQDPQRPMVVGD